MQPFRTPGTIWFGDGAAGRIGEACRQRQASRAAVIADGGIVKAGLLEGILYSLQTAGVEAVIWDRVVPEPPLGAGDEAVRFIRESGADFVIGVGGGSAMDLAKAAAVVAKHEGSVADYLNLTGTRKPLGRGIPVALLPTTAGTGSEVTDIAVFSLEGTKDVITHPYLLAEYAIVDPLLTHSAPSRVTAASGVDAFTHAAEAYLSVFASPLTDMHALRAMDLIGGSLRRAVWRGSDADARRDMALGSLLAGIAFYNAGVAGVHALAYPLGGLFKVPHGEANAVLLPYVFAYILPACLERMARIGAALGQRGHTAPSLREEAEMTIESIRVWIRDTGLPSGLSAYGVQASDLDRLAEDAAKQTRLLGRSPRKLEVDDIRRIYENALLER
jgi:alcohol dehydrogenase class IV